MELHFVIENEGLYDELPGIFEFHGQRADAIEAGTFFLVKPEDLYLLDGAALENLLQTGVITRGNTVLDLTAGTLRSDADCVRLRPRACSVLSLLMRSGENCMSKQQILHRVWGRNSTAAENNVEAYVGFLRRKLMEIHSDLQIETVRWQGYRVVKLKNP